MANDIGTIPKLETEIAALTSLRPAQRQAIIQTAREEAQKSALTRMNEMRKLSVERTLKARERFRKGVPGASMAVAGGAMSEILRRKVVGYFTDNLWGQALGVMALGGLAELGDNKLGIPIGGLASGAYGVAGMIGAVAGFDRKDKRDPVAVALQGTTAKYQRDMKKKEEKKE